MKEKILAIVNYYGIRHQIKYFQSEVFELSEAVIEKEENDKHIFTSTLDLIDICFKTGNSKVDHIAEEIADKSESVTFDPERLAWVEERLSTIYTLEKKFGEESFNIFFERYKKGLAVERAAVENL